MEFLILGPLEVRDDAGIPISVPGARERALLAVLVIHAGEMVSTDRLVDELWGEHQPARAVNALQAVVSRARRALGPRGADILRTRAPGYVLAIEPDEVDARGFERLLAEGRRLAERGAPGAVARLEAALALWRGPALADFAYEDFAQPERARLEEARLAALEDRIEAKLAAGCHHELAGELEQLVTANPLRERLRGQLMVALYRSGRQAEALNVYQDARSLLRDELGLDPSPTLRQLEQAILAQDPALLPVVGARPAARHNLPARVTSFVGRQQEMKELRKLLGRHRLVTLIGAGGAGKSSLALELAASLVDDQPAGAWLVEAAPLVDRSELEAAVARALGIAGAPDAVDMGAAGSIFDRVVEFLRVNDLLLVLDNCEHLVEACAGLVDGLLRSTPGLRVLATSREALDVAGEVVWPTLPLEVPDEATPVEMIPMYDAVRLFEERAAASRPGFRLDQAVAPVVTEICRRLDGIPLAIELAAARVRTLTLADIASRLDNRFHLLTGGGRTTVARHQTLQAAVDWSYGLLDERERRLFHRLSLFSGGWSLEAAERVCVGGGIEPDDVLDLLTRLADQSMVVSLADGRFRMLETMRVYASARLEESGEVSVVRRRYVAHYVALADSLDPQMHALEEWKPEGRLQVERDNLRGALAYALDEDDAEAALSLGGCLGWYWFSASHEEGRRRLRELLENAPDTPTRARARALTAYGLIEGFHRADRSLEASLAALAIYEELGDEWGAATARLGLAVNRIYTGQLTEAERLLDEAQAAFDEADDRRCEAVAWWLRSTLAYHSGDLDGSVEAGSRALDLFRELGDESGMATALGNLARGARGRGDYVAAIAMNEQSLALARSRHIPYIEQDILVRLGELFALLDEYERADELHAESLALAQRIDSPVGTATAYNAMGWVARRRGDVARAAEYHEKALAIYKDLGGLAPSGRQPDVVRALSGLGSCREASGEFVAAEECHRQALAVAVEHGDPVAIAPCVDGLAAVAMARGDSKQAARLSGFAAAVRDHARAPVPESERDDVERVVATVRAVLSDEEFDRAHSEGHALGSVLAFDELMGQSTVLRPT